MVETFQDLVAQLDQLTEKLKCTLKDDDRLALLKQFRALLDRADKSPIDASLLNAVEKPR